MKKVEKSVEINAPVADCYRIWSGFEQFPRFMKNVKTVQQTESPNIFHWTVDGPMGKPVEWDARVDQMEPNRVISWHSLEDSEVENSGEVRFEELGPQLTRVHVRMVYSAPAGIIGEMIAEIFKNPEQMVEEDLQNFERLVTENNSTAKAPLYGNVTTL